MNYPVYKMVRDVVLVVIGLVAIFVAGAVAEDVGFGAILVLMAVGVVAILFPLAMIYQEQSALGFRNRRLR